MWNTDHTLSGKLALFRDCNFCDQHDSSGLLDQLIHPNCTQPCLSYSLRFFFNYVIIHYSLGGKYEVQIGCDYGLKTKRVRLHCLGNMILICVMTVLKPTAESYKPRA